MGCFFRLLPFGDVSRSSEHAKHVALGVTIYAGVVEDIRDLAGSMANCQRVVSHGTLREYLLISLTGFLRISEVVGEITTDQSASAYAGDFFRGRIDVRDLALGADRYQRVKTRLD